MEGCGRRGRLGHANPGGDGVPEDRSDSRASAYWRTNLRILTILLSVWAVAGFGLGIIAVPWLNAIHVAGFPLGFWFAQQGSIVIFVILILVYAVWMDRVEERLIEAHVADWADFLNAYHEGVLGWAGGSKRIDGEDPSPEEVALRQELLRDCLDVLFNNEPSFQACWTYIKCYKPKG